MNCEKKKCKLNNPANVLLPVFLFVVLENFYGIEIAGTVSISFATFFLVSSFCCMCIKKIELNWNIIPILFILIFTTFVLKFVDAGEFNLILPDVIILFFFLICIIFRKAITRRILSNFGKRAVEVHLNFNLHFIAMGLTCIILTTYVVIFFLEKQFDLPYQFFGIEKLILFAILWIFIALKVRFLRKPLLEEEYLPILNAVGNAVGYESKGHVYSQKRSKKNIHPVIRILLILDNKLLLKKLDCCDLFYPGKWDISISGYLLYGETFESCISRLLKNNYNIEENNTRYLLKYTYENSYERQQVFLNYVYINEKIIQSTDLLNIKPWSVSQLLDELDSNIFTDKLKKEVGLLKDLSFPYLFKKNM